VICNAYTVWYFHSLFELKVVKMYILISGLLYTVV